MRSLQAILTSELTKDIFTAAHLFKLTATATYKWTDFSENIYFDSAWWNSIGITFDVIENSITQNVESVNITIPNVDKKFSDLVLSQDISGKSLNIYFVTLDNNLDPIGYTTEATLPIVFRGFVDSMEIDRLEAKISVASEFVRWKVLTPRRQTSPTCYKVFKSSDCAYVGAETWCDQSKTRCDALSNTVNFGGFEFISELADEEIYWGTRVKQWGSVSGL